MKQVKIKMDSTPSDEVENAKESSDDKNSEAQDAAQPPPTHINSLITDLAYNIFALLSTEERQRLRGVCSHWRKIIDSGFHLRIRIRNSTCDLVETCPHAYDVDLHSMTIPFQSSSISFFASVKTLRFTSIVVTYNLANFLRTCSGIKLLYFTNVVIDQPVGDEWSQKIWTEPVKLVNLEKVEIKCSTFAEGITDVTRLLHDKIQFGNLKEISIIAQNPPSLPIESLFAEVPDMSIAHCILQLIWKNQPSLEKFQIGRQNYPIILKFLERSKVKEPTFPLERQEYIARIQLEEFIVHPFFREDWTPVLRTQFNLKVLNIGSVNVSHWEEIKNCVIRNIGTLESFTIGGLGFGQAWDCAIFEPCVFLKTVNLLVNHSHKFNLNLLPLQLQHLHLFGPIPRFEIMAIAETLQNLETLRFSHLGRVEVGGLPVPEVERVTVTVVRALVKLPKLTLLAFIVCAFQAIDWERIGQWINSSFEAKDIVYEELYHTMHGEVTRDGMSLKMRRGLDREKIDWEGDVSTPPVESVSSPSVDESIDEGDDTDARGHHRAVHFNPSTISFP